MKIIVVKKRSDDFRDYGTDGKFSIYHLLGFQLLNVPESSSILSAREAAQKLEKTQNAFSDQTNLIAQLGRPRDGGSTWDEFVPYFYGNADIEKCLHEVIRLTSDVAYNNHCKIVLFISNGKPFVITDLEKWELVPMLRFFPIYGAVSIENSETYLERETEKLKMLHGVKNLFEINNFNVFSLYVSADPARSKPEVNELRLFCDTNTKDWKPSTQRLFKLSSKVECFKILPNVFQTAGWTVEEPSNPQERNEVKLFVHANNHANVSSACTFAKQIFTDKDCLSDILSEVSLASCINQKKNEAIPGNQGNSGDCLEYAAAAAMYLELHRKPNRQGGYPTVEKLRKELIEHFKSLNGKKYTDHLDSFAKTYRLRAQKVEYQDALEAASNMHFVIAAFSWNDREKELFEEFFRKNPRDVLRHLNLGQSDDEDERHAVVLTSFTSKFLRLMNSWGTEWGDGGFFKIKNSETLREMTFIKIYVDKKRLLTKERNYAALHGGKKAATFLKNLQGLKLSQHTCPSCKLSSRVSEFKGVMFHGRCPKCNEQFTLNTNSGGNLLLYQYLVSLSN